MLVSYGGTPTWRLHTGLCKFVQNISTNIWSLGKCTDLKFGELSSLFISYNITISWLYTLNDFRIIFLLHDSATQELYIGQRRFKFTEMCISVAYSGLNFRIPGHWFACHWIGIASFVFWFIRQRTLLNSWLLLQLRPWARPPLVTATCRRGLQVNTMENDPLALFMC